LNNNCIRNSQFCKGLGQMTLLIKIKWKENWNGSNLPSTLLKHSLVMKFGIFRNSKYVSKSQNF
jgi:hypothetical protein